MPSGYLTKRQRNKNIKERLGKERRGDGEERRGVGWGGGRGEGRGGELIRVSKRRRV